MSYKWYKWNKWYSIKSMYDAEYADYDLECHIYVTSYLIISTYTVCHNYNI